MYIINSLIKEIDKQVDCLGHETKIDILDKLIKHLSEKYFEERKNKL